MVKKSEIFIGAVFGRLTVVSEPFSVRKAAGNPVVYVNCTCSCGSGTSQRAAKSLLQGTKSCGCLAAEKWTSSGEGRSDSLAYRSWQRMLQSTTDPKHKDYENGKFRAPPERWFSFENFLADMGPRPEGTALERKNSFLGFSPKNCVWATPAVKSKNQSDKIFVAHNKHGVMTLNDAVNLVANGRPVPSRYKGKPLAFVFQEPGWDFSTYKAFLTKGDPK